MLDRLLNDITAVFSEHGRGRYKRYRVFLLGTKLASIYSPPPSSALVDLS